MRPFFLEFCKRLYNYYMESKLNKHLKTNEMINLLKERNLTIDTMEGHPFVDINYAHLIYKFGSKFLYNGLEDLYDDDANLSQIINYFDFNKALCQFMYDPLHAFEHKLKRTIAYIASEEDGFDYLNVHFYEKYTGWNIKDTKNLFHFVIKLVNIHERARGNSKKDVDIMPLWVFVDELSLGELSMFLKFYGGRMKVYDEIGLTASNLETIRHFRNAIFHMNPIKTKIIIKSKTFEFKFFFELLRKYMNEGGVKLFWEKNKHLIDNKFLRDEYKYFEDLFIGNK